MHGTTRPPPHRVWIPHPLNGKRASENSSKILVPIQRPIKSYGPFELLLLPDATRGRPHRVSIPHPLYGKGHPQTRKILIAIQRSDQKLWRVRTVTLAWRDQTSSSPSIDSTSTIWKGHPETHVKFWSRFNDWIKSYGPFEPLLLPGATRPPPQ